MILPNPKDAIHKAWMYRLLSAIADDTSLVDVLRFKGGTSAAMRGILPRFSVDLDFDMLETGKMADVRKHLEAIFRKLGLKIDDKSAVAPQYFLKYENSPNERNTLKLDVTFPPPKANRYEPFRFAEIDRILYVQTIPTMFANKLVALMDRYEQHGSIAGRDLFDIHTFFLAGYSYEASVIEERTGKAAGEFLSDLKTFIERQVTQTVIDHDLNTLLSSRDFRKVRTVLKREVMMFF